MEFSDKRSGLEVDLMVNKTVELFNSMLLKTYSQLDPRFLPVAHYLKGFNKRIPADKFHILNNYSMCLLLVAFLQHLKILPNL